MQFGRWTDRSSERIGGGVFIVAGALLLVATLLVEGSSSSSVVGLATATLILWTGILFGVPRIRGIAADRPARAVGRDSHAAQTLLVSVASALGAIAVCFGLAYLLRRLSRDADLGLDLGAVVILAASGALIYAGILQWVLRSRLNTPRK